MNKAFFRVFVDAAGEYRFNLQSRGNSEVILSSESYILKSSCLNGIDSVRRHASFDRYYDRLIAKDGSPYFTLKASNGEIIGVSEMYSSTAARDNGISAVQRDAADAVLKDDASQNY